ncbi:MAG: exodeoxyribonuclease V subunit alpha [Proteobacteria bacterium]|nr:exodeoxyribonuclease V subunit alpha [Pseudomonadota bacterium]
MNEIDRLYHQEIIRPIDFHFALFLGGLSGSASFPVMLAGALTIHATGSKHVCLYLPDYAEKNLGVSKDGHQSLQCPGLAQWRKTLRECSLVGFPGEVKPLILDHQDRLYLYRYWEYETILADEIRKRAESSLLPVDMERLKNSLSRLFPEFRETGQDLQAMAAVIAAYKKICIITGGPGTGKTTTVGKILAVLLEQPGAGDLKICLTAPTGKAAVRLGESIRSLKASLDISPDLLKAFPDTPSTIHRLLGSISRSSYFRHDKNNPLHADIVVVDEASMVDAALMAKLLQAVPDHARLILMGDKDQLASIEAGSVLGDICSGDYSEDVSTRWSRFMGNAGHVDDSLDHRHDGNHPENELSSCIVQLSRNYRFGENHILEGLSRAVKEGDFEKFRSVSISSSDPCLRISPMVMNKAFRDELKERIIEGYDPFLKAGDVEQALALFSGFRILCAVNKGSLGIEGINRFAESIFASRGLIRPDREFYSGRPVLIMENDYSLSLFNGDTGLIWKEKDVPEEDAHAYFPDQEGRLRRISPQRLPRHETAYAMTIHKSQGSEFESVLMVLPGNDSPGLTRELLYTGITRARSKLTLWANDALLKSALSRKIQRYSGLHEKLWK